jgi:hypothetical protein
MIPEGNEVVLDLVEVPAPNLPLQLADNMVTINKLKTKDQNKIIFSA